MILFENEGKIDIRAAITLGVSVKSETAIGFFGTGLKNAIAVILREGGSITLWSGKTKYAFTSERRKIKGQPFQIVQMNGKDLGFTTSYGKNWKPWQAFREIYANTLDEGGSAYDPGDVIVSGVAGWTRVLVEGAGFDDLLANKSSVFLEGEPFLKLKGIDVHEGASNLVYYRGLRAHENHRQALFTYNFTQNMSLTEDRTLQHGILVPFYVAQAIVQSSDEAFIERVLTADEATFEGHLNYADADGIKLSDTFMKVAARLRADGKMKSKSAQTLFTKAASESTDYIGAIVVDPSLVEKEMIKEAQNILLARCPNLTFPPARIITSSSKDIVFGKRQMTIPLGCIHAGPVKLAKELLKAVAAANAEETMTDWLVDIIIDRVAHIQREEEVE